MSQPEAWLRGPMPGIDPLLMPAAHALQQAAEDIAFAIAPLTPDQLWARPGGAAAVGYHARHLAGSIERLLTYVRGEQLTEQQLASLRAEGDPGSPPMEAAAVIDIALSAITRALNALHATDVATLHEPREVGRKRLPSTVLGLLFHIAEHTQRHAGQIVTTSKIVRAGG